MELIAQQFDAPPIVLQITPASTNPVSTECKLWNTFRVCGRDDQQGTVAGNYIDLQGQEHRHPAIYRQSGR